MYDSVLEHVGEPQKPSEREPTTVLDDWEALLFARALREWIGYGDGTEQEERVAEGLAEYLEMVVRDRGEESVPVYAHTRVATATLARATSWNVENGSTTEAVAVAEALEGFDE